MRRVRYRALSGLLLLTLVPAVTAGAAALRRGGEERNGVGPLTRDELVVPLPRGEQISLRTQLEVSFHARFEVETAGLELSLQLVGPDGGEIRTVRSGHRSLTILSVIAASSGMHELRVRRIGGGDVAGLVTARVVDKRPVNALDRLRLQAESSFAEAEGLRRLYQREASEQAILKYRAALQGWRQTGDRRQAVLAAQRLGLAHEEMGTIEKALSHYEEALRLSQQVDDAALQSRVQSDLGRARVFLGDRGAASRACSAALALARRGGSLRAEAEAHNCLGEAEYFRGDLKAASEHLHEAEGAWRQLGDAWGLAQTLLLLGYGYSDQSEFDRADTSYREALALWQEIGDKRGEALTLVALGRLASRAGEYQTALNSFHESMELVEPMGDPLRRATILAGIGSVYRKMGEYRNATAHWAGALDLYRQAGVPLAEMDALLTLGEVFLALGDPASALVHLGEARALGDELDNPRFKSDALRLIGLAHQSTGDLERALAQYEESLRLQGEGGDRRLRAYTLGYAAAAYEELGEPDRAREYYVRAIELSRAVRDRLGESAGLYRLAGAQRRQDHLVAAQQNIEESLRIAESLRAGVSSHELRSSYLASVHDYYELQVQILMSLHQRRPGEGLAAAALAASERARARSLLESLVEAGVDLQQGVHPDLLAGETRLKQKLDGKAERLIRLMNEHEPDDEVIALEAEIQELTDRYDRLRAEIKSRSPRYAALTQPQPLGLAQIQTSVLDSETQLLEYELGEEGSFLWAVSSDGLTSHLLPARAEIEQQARTVRRLLTARLPEAGEPLAEHRRRIRLADEQYWTAAARLSETLLGPVAETIAGKRLLVVAEGALQYLPFGALPVPGTGAEPVPMILEHEIVNLPSASTLAVLRAESRGRAPPTRSVVVIADPVFEADDPRLHVRVEEAGGSAEPPTGGSWTTPVEGNYVKALRQLGFGESGRLRIPRLVATRREAAAIVAAAPAKTSLQAMGFEASRSLATSPELAEYRIIHFATHGLVNSETPVLSGVVLSMLDERGRPQDGFLRLHDIYKLELPVELVVLSACNTALGKEIRGEGLVGIVRGFMYAGAKRVVASLWKVDDEATAELMGSFYRGMLGDGRSPASALRQAQIEMWGRREWRHPFFWAAFVLQGEWR